MKRLSTPTKATILESTPIVCAIRNGPMINLHTSPTERVAVRVFGK